MPEEKIRVLYFTVCQRRRFKFSISLHARGEDSSSMFHTGVSSTASSLVPRVSLSSSLWQVTGPECVGCPKDVVYRSFGDHRGVRVLTLCGTL